MNDVRVDGRKLKHFREAQHLTQGQLAIKSGVGQSHISRLEVGGRRNAHISTVVKLSSALEVPLEELLVLPPGAKTPEATTFDLLDPRLKVYLQKLAHLPLEDQELITNIIAPIIEREEREKRESKERRRKS